MVEDKSIRETADEQQSDAGGNASEEFADTPKRTSVWRGVARVIGEVAVNLLIGGLPFFAAGVFWRSDDVLYSQTPEWARAAPWAIIAVGAAIVAVGFSVSLISRPRLSLLESERVLEIRHPSIKPPLARTASGVLVFAIAGGLLWLTTLPYIVPLASFVFGMHLYLKGITTYWINHHTAYYATNRRVARLYRFVDVDRTILPINSVLSATAHKSFLERLTRRGNVVVESGVGARHKVTMKEIDDPDPMERTINEMITPRPSQ